MGPTPMDFRKPHFPGVHARVRVDEETLLEIPRREVLREWNSGIDRPVERIVNDHHVVDVVGLAAVELGDGCVRLRHRTGEVVELELPEGSELIVGTSTGGQRVEHLRALRLGRDE